MTQACNSLITAIIIASAGSIQAISQGQRNF
jgi:hypothetical protein